MKKILLALAASLFASSALAADLPVKAAPFAAPAEIYTNGFYGGVRGGVGTTGYENVIAAPGLVVGTPKQYPTSPSIGGVVGYLNASGPLAWGGELAVDYNFSDRQFNCIGLISCLGQQKNSWAFGEDFLFGINLGQVIPGVPTSARPRNWRFPITVSSSAFNNILLLASVGGAQREVSLCALDLITNQNLCGSQWLSGLAVGGQFRVMISDQTSLAAIYHHNFYSSSFTPAPVIPIFTNTVRATGEDTFKVGIFYNFM